MASLWPLELPQAAFFALCSSLHANKTNVKCEMTAGKAQHLIKGRISACGPSARVAVQENSCSAVRLIPNIQQNARPYRELRVVLN
jgi:hypothetical protein